MTSFRHRPWAVAITLAAGVAAFPVRAGNQELVERKAAELHAVNEQIARKVAPAGLKEGDAVEVKASVRVERTLDQGVAVRDLSVERVRITAMDGTSCATGAVSCAGAGAVKKASVADKQPTVCMPGFRQGQLDVPVVEGKGKE